ncbi:hypothetical protein GCM10009678_43110 [Actinomadura kijaniata]|uniref:Uncharacterized protein n=1 Tax=Actinomadura namibiensis TaxID=182080 RepID=A0A7W3LU05_ACTNM|nr:hypothetical protein [Actinomadura namibiensis]MBA8954301.1 hypothetical protein [Actinomadura namibiensis]
MHPLDDPRFWTRFLLGEEAAEDDDDDEDGFEAHTVEFALSDGHGLRLDLEPDIDMYTLSLLDGPELGWDDEAHPHPHVLRCAELDLLCRAWAVTDPSAAHPGAPLVLLGRFAIVTEDAELDAVAPLVETALRRVAAPLTVGAWLERRDFRDAGVTWRHDPRTGRWTVGQDSGGDRDLYSLRSGDGFPAAGLAGLLAEAERVLEEAFGPWRAALAIPGDPVREAPALARRLRDAGCDHPAIPAALASPEPAERCWVLEELAGLERGALLRRLAPVPRPRVHRFDLEVDAPGDRALRIVADLDAELSSRGLGGAEITGGGMTRNAAGEIVGETAHLEVLVHGDPDRARAVVRDVLARHGETPPGGQREGLLPR